MSCDTRQIILNASVVVVRVGRCTVLTGLGVSGLECALGQRPASATGVGRHVRVGVVADVELWCFQQVQPVVVIGAGPVLQKKVVLPWGLQVAVDDVGDPLVINREIFCSTSCAPRLYLGLVTLSVEAGLHSKLGRCVNASNRQFCHGSRTA